MSTKELPAQPIKGLIEGMTVLQQVASVRKPVSTLELAVQLGMEKTRVNRILKTLAYAGMVHRTSNRRYLPGPGLHILSGLSLSSSGLLHNSIFHLEELVRFGHVIALGVLWDDNVSYLFHHLPGTPFLDGIGKNLLFPATMSSLGMILLSQKTDRDIMAIYDSKESIPGYDDIKSLLDSIRNIRKTGHAALDLHGHLTIAVKIGKPAYAAIGVSGSINQKEINAFVEILQNKATLIEKEMLN